MRTEEEEIGQLRVDGDLLDKLTEERDQLRRRAVVAQRQSPLSEADRDAKLATLAAGQRALRADTEAAASVERSARAALEEEFDSREVETEVAASNVKLLRLLELGNSVSRRMWEQRYGLGQAGNPAASAKATEEPQLMLARVRQFRTYMLAVLDHLCRRLEAEEHRKAGLASNARRDAERRVRAVRDGEAVLRRALRDTDGVEALPGNWLESLRMQREAASVADRLRFTVTCRVAYRSVVRHVMKLLRRAVDEHPRIRHDALPEVFIQQFGDSAFEFRTDFWLDIRQEPNWLRVMSEVRVRIDELFREAGIVFALPQRDLHVDVVAPVRVEWTDPAAQTGHEGATFGATRTTIPSALCRNQGRRMLSKCRGTPYDDSYMVAVRRG